MSLAQEELWLTQPGEASRLSPSARSGVSSFPELPKGQGRLAQQPEASPAAMGSSYRTQALAASVGTAERPLHVTLF